MAITRLLVKLPLDEATWLPTTLLHHTGVKGKQPAISMLLTDAQSALCAQLWRTTCSTSAAIEAVALGQVSSGQLPATSEWALLHNSTARALSADGTLFTLTQ